MLTNIPQVKWFLLCIKKKLTLQEYPGVGETPSSVNDARFLSTNDQPKELYFSSDAHALVEHTKKVLVIEDGEVVHLKVFILHL